MRWFYPIVALACITAASAQPAPAGRDGLYVGDAISLRRGAYNCPAKLALKGFRVDAGQVQFGRFRGPIQADGSVSIPNKNTWLTGRFSGTEFRGEFNQYIPNRHESCSYTTVLQRQSG